MQTVFDIATVFMWSALIGLAIIAAGFSAYVLVFEVVSAFQ